MTHVYLLKAYGRRWDGGRSEDVTIHATEAGAKAAVKPPLPERAAWRRNNETEQWLNWEDTDWYIIKQEVLA